TLTALEGDNDVSLVQSIALTYGHTYAADGNQLRMTAAGGEAVRVTSFTNPTISVVDITDPLHVTQVPGTVSSAGAAGSRAYNVHCVAPGAAGTARTLLALTADRIAAPAALAHHAPQNVLSGKGADAVIVTHADFVEALAPLEKLRQ